MRKQTALWRMKNGEKIRICDMGDDHLKNAIRLVQRNYRRSCLAVSLLANRYAFSPMTPDGASDLALQEADQAQEEAETLENLGEEYPIYYKLQAEHTRRFGEPLD